MAGERQGDPCWWRDMMMRKTLYPSVFVGFFFFSIIVFMFISFSILSMMGNFECLLKSRPVVLFRLHFGLILSEKSYGLNDTVIL